MRICINRMEANPTKTTNKSETDIWEQISLPNALTKYRDYLNVAHCMLWFKTSHQQKAHTSYAFLQLRFDGLLGFPGGVVDEDIVDIESVIDALQREMREEINYCDPITTADYFYTYFNKTKKFVSHFFVKQISLKDAEKLEQTHTQAVDFPQESLGLFRIPIGCSYDSKSTVLLANSFRNLTFFMNFKLNMYKVKYVYWLLFQVIWFT